MTPLLEIAATANLALLIGIVLCGVLLCVFAVGAPLLLGAMITRDFGWKYGLLFAVLIFPLSSKLAFAI
jgi:hypothetical protein